MASVYRGRDSGRDQALTDAPHGILERTKEGRDEMHGMGRFGRGVAIVAVCAAATLAGAESHEEGEAGPMRRQMRMHHGPREPLHGEMREKMRAHDARLDELVDAMNAAKGEAKIDAMAAVLNELVAQRRTRRDHMEERWKRQQGRKGRMSSEPDTP